MPDYYRSSFLEHPLCRELNIGSVARTGSTEKKSRSLDRRCAMDFITTRRQTNNGTVTDETKNLPFYKYSRRSSLPVIFPEILAHKGDEHKERRDNMIAPRCEPPMKIRYENENQNHEKENQNREEYRYKESPSTPSFIQPLDPPLFKLRPVQEVPMSRSTPGTLPGLTKGADDITVIASNESPAHIQSGELTTCTTSKKKEISKASTVAAAGPNNALDAAVLLACIRNLMGETKAMNPDSVMPKIPIRNLMGETKAMNPDSVMPKIPSLEKRLNSLGLNKGCNDEKTIEKSQDSNCFHKGFSFDNFASSTHARPRIVSMDVHSGNNFTPHSLALCTQKSRLGYASQLDVNKDGKESSVHSFPSFHPVSLPNTPRVSMSMTDVIHQRRAEWKKRYLLVEDHSKLFHTNTDNSIFSDNNQVKMKISPGQSSSSLSQPAGTTEITRTILRKKFSWKHYPELEAFLIENRDEYLRHSVRTQLHYGTKALQQSPHWTRD